MFGSKESLYFILFYLALVRNDRKFTTLMGGGVKASIFGTPLVQFCSVLEEHEWEKER